MHRTHSSTLCHILWTVSTLNHLRVELCTQSFVSSLSIASHLSKSRKAVEAVRPVSKHFSCLAAAVHSFLGDKASLCDVLFATTVCVACLSSLSANPPNRGLMGGPHERKRNKHGDGTKENN